MAAKKKAGSLELGTEAAVAEAAASPYDEFADELIASLNREHGSRFAYNLATDTSPTHVKRWISSGSKYLDYTISNRRDGGFPEGRIIEISGPPSCGKSHIAAQVCKTTQKLGGLVVYIDTENATSPDNLAALGVDVAKRFVYVDTHCTEEVFKVIESTIIKAKQKVKDVPITVIWDSVAATSPKAELDGDYDQNTIGLQARVLSKGMRKITGIIGENNVTLICLNQIRMKVGVVYGSPETTPGGMAIPFHASVRLKISTGAPVKDKDGNVIGIEVDVTTEKNKLTAPRRKCSFQIHFGKGIVEHELLFDELRAYCDKNKVVTPDGLEIKLDGAGAWKEFLVTDKDGVVRISKKFHKPDFLEVMNEPEYKPYIDQLMDAALIRKPVKPAGSPEASS